MAFSGGTFTKLYEWLADIVTNEKIFRSRLDDEFGGIATGLTTLWGRTRQVLTGTLNLYVDNTNGASTNSGLAPGLGNALDTLQHAVDLIKANFDLNGHTVNINTTTSGAYAHFTVDGPWPGGGTVNVIGSPNLTITAATNANPSVLTAAGHDYVNGDHVVISGALVNTAINGAFKVANANIGAGTFTLQNENTSADIAGNGVYTASSATVAAPSRVTISGTGSTIAQNGAAFNLGGFKISSSNGQLAYAWKHGHITFLKNQYDASGSSAIQQIWATQFGLVEQFDNYSISGGGDSLFHATHLGKVRQSICIGTFISNVTYSNGDGCLYVLNSGDITTTGSPGGTPWNTNGFTVLGKKFRQEEQGVIQIEGLFGSAAAAKVPGSIAADSTYISKVKVLSFTRDLTIASGNQSVAGAGFKPLAAQFLSGINGGAKVNGGGFTDFTTMGGHQIDLNGLTINTLASAVAAGPTDGSNFQLVTAITADQDGFTVSWVKVGAPTGIATVYVMLWG